MSTSISRLPAKPVDPYKLADQRVELEGEVPVSSLRRAGDLLVSDEGTIRARLEFGRDEENRRVVQGELDARVWVTCQRCLEPMEEHVRSRFALAVVGDDEAARQIPGHYEPLEIGASGIKLPELVEDELLLAMPPFPVHPEQECPVDLDVLGQSGEEPDPVAAEGRKRPFELLEGLLDRKDDKSSRH